MDLRTDQTLAAEFAAGDAASFGVLYDRHAPAVYSAACALLGPGGPASAAVAAVFQRLAREIPRRRRVVAAPITRLDRLIRGEIRRRLRLRGLLRSRRSTDGLDRTLPPGLRASVLSLATAPRWRPTRSVWPRVVLGVAAVGCIVGVVSGGAWLGRSILQDSDASEVGADPGAPGAVAEPVGEPATSVVEVAVLPPVPPSAPTDPAGSVVVAPAAVQLSASVVDLGKDLVTGSLVLRNTSADVQLWNVEGDPAPFEMLASPGALEPGGEATIAFGIDRSLLTEGTYEVPLTIAGSTPQTVTLRAEVDSAPRIAIVRATPQLLFACEGGSIELAAQIADDSPIASATVSWIGPGVAGSAPMTAGSEWVGTITPDLIPGTWAYAVQAVDARGNPGSAVGIFQVSSC